MVTDADVHAALRQERIRQHRHVLPLSLAASGAMGAVLVVVLWDSAPRGALLGWLATLAAALALRAGVGLALRRDTAAAANAGTWLLRHRIAFVVHGLAWAAVPALLLRELPPASTQLVVVAMAAVVAGGFIGTAFDLAAAFCFAVPAVAALVLGLASRAEGAGAAPWVMAALFMGVTVAGAVRGQRAVREGVRLRLAADGRAEQVRETAARADGARRQLADQHQLMGQMLQTTQQGFWFIDGPGRTTELNPAMAQLLGRPRETVLGQPITAFFSGDDLAVLQRELAARAGGSPGHYDIGLVRADGTRTDCECHASPIFDAGGAQIGSVGIFTDTSARRRADAMLRGYELVVNSITDPVSVVDTEERYLLVNDAWCRATGVTREDALGRRSTLAAPTTVSPERRRALSECVATGQRRAARGHSLGPGLADRTLETTYFPHLGEDARVQAVAMLTRDITEQEAQRAALEVREAEQRAFLEAFPGYIGRMDSSLAYSWVNQRLAALLGRAPEQLVGRTPEQVIGPEGAAERREWAQRALAGEVVVYEQHLPQPGGAPALDLQLTLSPGVDPVTGAPAVYGFGIDISALKRAERALRDSEAELRALLAAFPGYIAAMDAEGRYTYVNERLTPVFGRAPQDSVGRHVRDVWGEARWQHVKGHLDRARTNGQPSVTEGSYTTVPDGRRLDLEITHVVGPLQADGRQSSYSFGIDITARKRADEALIAARDEAERANRAKSQFLSQMSHELRTPLNAILGFGQLLDSDQQQPLAAPQQAWVREILRGAGHLLGLINEILDLGRIEAGELVLEPAALDLQALVAECLGLVQALAASRGVSLHALPAALQGVHVAADRRRLMQVLLNLLGNAIKYNRASGEVGVLFRSEGDTFWLAVRDNGRGLSAAEQARLFQPFERLSAAQSGIEGTGIGLALSRRLVQAMGGRIGVDSEAGVGSTFWLRLPHTAQALGGVDTPTPAAATTASAAVGTALPQSVLYIEDNAVNVVLMEAMLGRLPGLRVRCALTPSEGLRLAQAETPALVLLDIQLPEMNGFEVLSRLRADPATQAVPVVAVSANALQADIDAALAAGFNAYITKPLVLEDLLATVQRALRGGPARAS
jgi:PAS domain S-box-containing protein